MLAWLSVDRSTGLCWHLASAYGDLEAARGSHIAANINYRTAHCFCKMEMIQKCGIVDAVSINMHLIWKITKFEVWWQKRSMILLYQCKEMQRHSANIGIRTILRLPIDMNNKSISQSIRQISPMHHLITEMCKFLLQNGALWDMGLVNCGICATGLVRFRAMFWIDNFT